MERIQTQAELITRVIHKVMTGEDLDEKDEGVVLEALERRIPVKPKIVVTDESYPGNFRKVCPRCNRVLMERRSTPETSYPIPYNMTPHCICGQAIDWE